MKRVLICTAFSDQPLHPRVEMQMKLLNAKGIPVRLLSSSVRYTSKLWHFLNLTLLKYFRFDLIHRYSAELDTADIIHIYDLRLLPLARRAKRKGKQVIYETLDDNVFLNFHGFQKLFPPLRLVRGPVTFFIAKLEQRMARRWCDQIIVNSKNLLGYFPAAKTQLIFYASPFEGANLHRYAATKPFAFLYLGQLSAAKGANEYMQLIKQYQLPFLFFGKAMDAAANELITLKKVIHFGNVGSQQLKEKLLELSAQYNLIGCSIIHPENKSYMWQEANKDIDYMCLEIPLLGNTRPPTFEKIKAGCGLTWDDTTAFAQLLSTENSIYPNMVEAGTALYQHQFSKAIFSSRYLEIIERLNAGNA